ncbi:ATP-binding protein [Rhodopirellula bahusiensis]|uniref:histidine kinase n=1 Tax=Rhodopirellula bahusiensis TaxID=2014065 RepID=A0A2G1W072_9BACT|nr:ATP-binding protein [Rhodopirellula bahusiensis]PHQ32250.1 hybrid sensor histidine kinase/response regulator [Rhodopirellula bahusiensis]
MSDELTILLVEDDPDSLANMVDILDLDGHRVRVAQSFAEVLNAAPQPSIELAILDRRLPDGEVEDHLAGLSERLPNAEFIIVTGFANMEGTIASFKHGVTDYLLKPVHPDVIRQSVARIAKQKRVEADLQRQQRFANQLLETSEAFIVVLDLTGRIVHFNKHFSEVTGWQLDDLIGRDYIDHCTPEPERERVGEIFQQTALGRTSSGVRNGLLTKSDRVRQIRWSDSTLKDASGNIESVLAIGIDVTDIIDAQEAAARDHRLAAIGQTVAGLAHESRNALQRINASVELLRLDLPLETDTREEVDSIARAANELGSTLEEVREYAAPIRLHRESVKLQEVWRQVWSNLSKSRGDRDAELIETQCDCGCPAEVDTLRLEQVFRNLFENSLAACENPVRIQIECLCKGTEDIHLDYSDNGPGLSAEQQQKLFDPFFTTKVKGTGLGMSIVQRIIEAHGGDIRVVKPVHCGARFRIRLGKDDAIQNACSGESKSLHA